MSDFNQLEAEINNERAALTSTLDSLTNTLAPDRIVNKLTSSVEGYGGELGRQAWDTAKQNPAAFALVAAGLGLLMTGTGSNREREIASRYHVNDPETAMEGFDERLAIADADIKAAAATESAAPKASWLRDKLESGLEALPAPARRRVIKARKAAIAAQENVEAKTAEIARRSRSFHGQQPLAVGAVALGFGALIGALLPSTRREDMLLGQHRDALMANAQNALASEMAKLKGAVQERVDVAANRMQSEVRTGRKTIR